MRLYVNNKPLGKEYPLFRWRMDSSFLCLFDGVFVDIKKGGGINIDPVYRPFFEARHEAGQVVFDVSLWRTNWFATIILMGVPPYIHVGITSSEMTEYIDEE
jgi:hypothetical protein